MIGFLRFVGILNAAVWLGAAVFYTFGVLPTLASRPMQELLTARNYPFFSVAIAQTLTVPFFHLQLVCSVVALFHVVAEWLYLGKVPQKLWRGVLAGLVAVNLISGFWLQPELKNLHRQAYGLNTPPQARNAALGKFRTWQSGMELINLLVVAGLGAYFWRIANPPDQTRFVSATKFRS